jgi:hypothetical protein
MFAREWSIEALVARIATLLNRRRKAQAIGDAGLKRVIEEEIAEAREEHQQQPSRLGGTIVAGALRSPDSTASRAKR